MNELSRRMMVTGGNVTGITDQLVAEGLVERMEVAGDRRAFRVRLTDQGRQSFTPWPAPTRAGSLTPFPASRPDDMATLHRLLGEVKHHFQEPHETLHRGGNPMRGQFDARPATPPATSLVISRRCGHRHAQPARAQESADVRLLCRAARPVPRTAFATDVKVVVVTGAAAISARAATCTRSSAR
jgi:hypothetical protein